MINLRGIGYIGLNVPDQEQWNDYAENVIGLQRVAAPTPDDAATYFKADDRSWRIAVQQGAQAGIAFVGFEVLSKPALHQAIEHLRAQGVTAELASGEIARHRGVQELVQVTDPGGNQIEIFWGPNHNGGFVSPVGVTEFNSEGGFGHVVYLVKDLAPMMDFYLEALGMRLTDFVTLGPGMSVQFLRCTPRHHTVALTAVGPIEGAHHLAFQVPDIDQVGAALERATKAGAKITASIGRHKNDRMLSFYMRSPAGFEVEIGCDPRVVDEETWVANEFSGGDLWGHHGLTGDSMSESVEAQGSAQ